MHRPSDPAPTGVEPQGSEPQPSDLTLFWRGFVISVAGILTLSLAVVALGLGAYVIIALRLPSPTELRARAASFVSTKIYDRNGELLWEIFDPTGGKRTLVPLKQIPASLINATIATEDPTFYSNPGFSPLAIARAFWQDLTEREIVSGGSTITQQLVKSLFVGREVTLKRKIQEAVLAAEITRTYNKDTILEIYLNEIYYGNLAYGVAAAAETYFGKEVSDLTLGESALMVGLVPAPVAYDPYQNLPAALEARKVVLDRMVKHGYITQKEADAAAAEPVKLKPLRYDIKAPHFVFYVRQLLEQKYGTDLLYHGGLQVHTTLDLRMQQAAEQVAQAQIKNLIPHKANNIALVAIDPATGEIRAMLGSVDYNDASIDGQVNVALRPRQPGSSIKPLTYVAAFEKGWTPATMIMDVNTKYPDPSQPSGFWEPKNYDDKEHGPVSVRTALANSYNIPAVKTLQYIGVDSLLEMARRLGIKSLNQPFYGLSLTLGGGEVTPLELTGAYTAFATGGIFREPTAILSITDSSGKEIYKYDPGQGRQVLDPRQAYLITSILSDNNARTPTFGANSVLNLSKPAAAKTGTTNDYKDAWTVGYTTSLVTGVWVGRTDNKEMDRLAGSSGAGPVWHDFMEKALPIMEAEGRKAVAFPRPQGLVEVEVCSVSGQLPTPDCPDRRKELFVAGTEPKETCSVHRKIKVCTVSGKLATEFCPANAVEEKLFEVYPPDGQEWALAHNKPQPPTEKCDVHTGQFNVAITSPHDGDTVSGEIEIRGSAQMSDMRKVRVEYGVGEDPQGWGTISEYGSSGIVDGHISGWNTNTVPNGVYTIRVRALDSRDNSQEARIRVRVANRATPTPTPFPTATATPTLTETPTPSRTPRASATPPPTGTPEPQSTPSATAVLPENGTSVPTPKH